MTTELKIAIENLYSTFSVYPLKPVIEGCPCCVSGADKEKIHSRPLRQLEEEDLSRYAFKAMTTWGDTDDFKHYLPRILELLATDDFIVDTSVVSGKLEYGQWGTWNENEKTAITEFLLAWWSDSVKFKDRFDKDLFTGVYHVTKDLDELLDRWIISLEDKSILNVTDFIYHYFNDLVTDKKEFRDFDEASIQKLFDWIKSKAAVLEKGFFHFEKTDASLAGQLSAALYIVDRINENGRV